jgi:hypothetical protein
MEKGGVKGTFPPIMKSFKEGEHESSQVKAQYSIGYNLDSF